jgi:hypothetical protein
MGRSIRLKADLAFWCIVDRIAPERIKSSKGAASYSDFDVSATVEMLREVALGIGGTLPITDPA